MKSVCKYCGGDELIRWGDRRRYCSLCNKTFSVPKAGRKASRTRDMYLLDRSTYRRIGNKKNHSHPAMIKTVQKEISTLTTPMDWLKKTYIGVQKSWSLTLSMYLLKDKTIANTWLSILMFA